MKLVDCVNLATPLSHDPIHDQVFDRRSRADSESGFVGPFRVRQACLYFLFLDFYAYRCAHGACAQTYVQSMIRI